MTIEAGRTVEASLEIDEGSLVESPWLWIAVGGAVAIGAAVTAGVLLRDHCTCLTNGPPCTAPCP